MIEPPIIVADYLATQDAISFEESSMKDSQQILDKNEKLIGVDYKKFQ